MIARIISGILIYALAVTQVVAQTAALLPNAKQTFLGTTGAPLAAGTVTLYTPNSTNKKTTWVDPNQASANTNPVVLDAAGRAVIFGQGNYRQVVKDKNGVTIWDAFTSAYGSASPSGSTGTDTAPVGTVIPYSGFAIPTNWQLSYGQPLNRTAFAQLLTAITISNNTVSCTASSTTLTGFVSTASFSVGNPIEATCLPANTTVASITNSSTIVASQNAVSSGTVTGIVFPWGNGDGNSTFNVPDLRGRAFAGADAMGGTSAGRLSPTYYGASAAAPGVSGGSQSHTLTAAESAPLAFTSAVTDPGHVHGLKNSTTLGGAITRFNSAVTTSSSASESAGNSDSATTGITVATSSNAGGLPHSIVQPTMTVNYIIKVAPNASGAGGVVSIGGMFGDIVCDATFLCANQTIGLATQLTGTILGNLGASTMTPTAVTLSQIVDYTCGSAQGDIFYRGASNWACLPPGATGQVLATQGAAADPIWTSVTTIVNQLANKVYSGPTSGAAAAPTFRSLVVNDLPTVNSNIGSWGSSTAIPFFTVDAQGLVTAAGTNAVVAPAGTLTGSTLSSNVITSSLTAVGALSSGSLVAGFSAIANARLANSSTTVNGQTCTLGSTCTIVLGSNVYENFQTETSLSGNFSFFRYNAGYTVNSSGNLASIAASNPRFNYNPLTKAAGGLEIEQPAFQFFTGQDFGTSPWSTSNATWMANSVVGPSGATDMGLVTESGGSAAHVIFATFAAQPNTLAFSMYMKAGTRRYVSITYDNVPSGSWGLVVDTSTWTICTTGTTGSAVINATQIASGPNGTQRVEIVATRSTPSGTTYIEIAGQDACTYEPSTQVSAGGGTWYMSNPQIVAAGILGTSYTPYPPSGIGRLGDIATFTMPSTANAMRYYFTDGSNQLVPTVPGPNTIPGDLNHRTIAYMALELAPIPQDVIITHGDSITEGTYADHPYSTYLANSIQSTVGLRPLVLSRGVSGIGYCQTASPYGQINNTLVTDAPTYIDPVLAYYPNAKLIVWGGVNDIYGSYTVPQTETCFTNYMAARISAGWLPANIYVVTMLPNSGTTLANQIVFNQFQANYCRVNGCQMIRVDQVANFGTVGASTGPYYADGLHASTDGQSLTASTAFAVTNPARGPIIPAPAILLAWPGGSPASGAQTSATTVAAPVGSLVCLAAFTTLTGNTSPITGVTDTAGNTYAKIVDAIGPTASYQAAAIWCSTTAFNLPIGSKLTATLASAGSYFPVIISSVATGGTDQAVTTTVTGTSITSTTSAVALPNELALVIEYNNGSAYIDTSGFTSIGPTNPSASNGDIAYKIITGPGTVTFNPSWTGSQAVTVGLATFKATVH